MNWQPTRYTEPLSEHFPSDGDRLIELVELAWRSPENPDGIKLDEWQKWLLRHVLERYPDDYPDPEKAGRLRYRQVVVSLGRQNGKSVLGAILALYGLLLHEFGPQVMSIASNVDQARIIYNRVLYVIQNNKSLSKRFKKATEQRGIVSADGGGRYDVKPAKEAALQGIPVSLVLFDELHLAKAGMWTACVLGTKTRKDGMVIGITTAGDDSSTTLKDLYEKGEAAIKGDTELERFGFFCWEAPEHAPVNDPSAIMMANPSVAEGRVPLSQAISDMQSLPEHEARRYVLNQFISGSAQSWLPSHLFHEAVGTGIGTPNKLVFAIDRAENWTFATIAAASLNGDTYETELVASYVSPSEDQLYNDIFNLVSKHNPVGIAIDDRQMPNLAKRLKQAGITTYSLWTKEVAAACSFVYSEFAKGTVKHKNDPLLAYQMSKGIIKYQGEQWHISRKESTGDIDALLATIMAIYVCSIVQTPSIQVF